jgi:hypothetical protein
VVGVGAPGVGLWVVGVLVLLVLFDEDSAAAADETRTAKSDRWIFMMCLHLRLFKHMRN